MIAKIGSIAATGLRRFLREKENIFFVFIFPILIIMFVGLQFGGGFDPVVGVVGAEGPIGRAIVEEVGAANFVIVELATEEEALEAVELSEIEAAIIIPEGDPVEGTVEVQFMAREGFGMTARSAVQSAVTDLSAELRAARYVADTSGMDAGDAAAAVDRAASFAQPIDVSVSLGGEPWIEGEMEQFDLGASSQLVLFTFLTSLSTSGHLILSRKLGVSSRMLVSPTSAGTIVIGETLGRYLVALVQALFIVLATALLFGVDWGDPLGSAAVVGLFALVSTAAGMLLGSFVQNDQQAGGMGVMLGIGLGALGGAMVPYEIFPEAVQRASQVTPHYWALRGFRQLLFVDGSIADVVTELGALAAFAAVFLMLASWAYRRAILK